MSEDLDTQSQDLRSGRGGRSGGAQQTVNDPRLTKILGWLAAGLLATTIGVGSWVATSINGLTTAVAETTVTIRHMATTQATADARNELRNDQQDSRINQLDRDVAEVHGKIFRGVAGYGEPRRGN
jgi:hypothetical protein